jgi:hypothetical protein
LSGRHGNGAAATWLPPDVCSGYGTWKCPSHTRAKRNIAADLQGALIAPQGHAPRRESSIPQGVGALLLRAIDGYDGHPVTQWALRRSAPCVFRYRPGELRLAEWSGDRPGSLGMGAFPGMPLEV